jgi:LytS/YehU family sensor histidine kinase
VLLNSVVESALQGHPVLVIGVGLGPFLVLGVWLYLILAGVGYAARAAERAARAEAMAARSQLAALRAQLNPHFLFNALHTVQHLIPREPGRAAAATEQLAGLLRTTLEEDRDEVSLGEELDFVERYLEIERIRFGDRLRVRVDVPPAARDALVPSFALQTLVENALRHGAGPSVEPTDVTIAATVDAGALRLVVRDTGAGADAAALATTPGSGLARLRERLAALHEGGAALELATSPGAGFAATLVVPQERE